MAERVPTSHQRDSDEIVVHDAPGDWEVIEVQPGPHDGRPAAIRGWHGPALLWAGTRVLRSLGSGSSGGLESESGA